ncbi:MAG: hypothetical protein HRF50_05055 [Phycisphaerae bacterium]
MGRTLVMSIRDSSNVRALGIALAAALASSGCGFSAQLFNAEFLNTIGFGGQAASLPGEAAAAIVGVENGVANVVEFRLTWRDANGRVQERIQTLDPGVKFAEAVICPMEEVTLGDVADLTATGAVVRLGGQTSADPVVEVEPFGFLLQEGINYDCGDSVVFRVMSSGETASGYRIFAYLQRSGAQSEDLLAESVDGTGSP